MKKVFYYIIIPVLVITLLVLIIFSFNNDFEKSIDLTLKFIQIFAILVGGIWAYRKFDWNKKAESAIKLKAMLMKYDQIYNQAAIIYRKEKKTKKAWM